MSSERFTEQVDQAQEQQMANNERGIARVRDALAPETHPDFDGLHCVEPKCGDLLPKERRLLGRMRCVGCQAAKERTEKTRRR